MALKDFKKLDPKAFAGTALDFGVRDRIPRVICAVDGRDKTGKSHFCYDAPDPVAVLSFDFGDEDVVQKFQDQGRQIVIADLKWEVPAELRRQQGTAVQGEALQKYVDEKVWTPFVQLTKKIIDSGQFRSVVVDKATEAWQVCRLSVFGRAATTRQDYQTEANSRWREYVRMFNVVETLPINLMLIHEQREEWVSHTMTGKDGTAETKWSKSGAWVRDGNEKIPYLIPLVLEKRFFPPKKHPLNGNIIEKHRFETEIKVCRGHPEVVGTVFTSQYENDDWLTVMSTARPEIPLEDWGHAMTRG